MKHTPPSAHRTKKTVLYCLVSLLLSSQLATAETGRTAPETIDLNAQANFPAMAGLPADKKSVKSFSHAAHASRYLKGNAAYAAAPFQDDFTCKACHQAYGAEEELLIAAPEARLATALETQGGAGNLKNYFHSICLQCHKNMKKAAIATGPTDCKGCHNR